MSASLSVNFSASTAKQDEVHLRLCAGEEILPYQRRRWCSTGQEPCLYFHFQASVATLRCKVDPVVAVDSAIFIYLFHLHLTRSKFHWNRNFFFKGDLAKTGSSTSKTQSCRQKMQVKEESIMRIRIMRIQYWQVLFCVIR